MSVAVVRAIELTEALVNKQRLQAKLETEFQEYRKISEALVASLREQLRSANLEIQALRENLECLQLQLRDQASQEACCKKKEDVEAWIRGLDGGKGSMMQFSDALQKEFGDQGWKQQLAAAVILPDPGESSVLDAIDPIVFDILDVQKAGHKLLLARGMVALCNDATLRKPSKYRPVPKKTSKAKVRSGSPQSNAARAKDRSRSHDQSPRFMDDCNDRRGARCDDRKAELAPRNDEPSPHCRSNRRDEQSACHDSEIARSSCSVSDRKDERSPCALGGAAMPSGEVMHGLDMTRMTPMMVGMRRMAGLPLDPAAMGMMSMGHMMPGAATNDACQKAVLQTHQEVLGEYFGVIKSYNPEKGFGFIACDALKEQHDGDVYLHQRYVGEFQVGAEVRFQAYLHQGRLQGRDLQYATGQVTPQKVEFEPAGDQDILGEYFGVIKSYNPEKGFGFISCDALKEQHSGDVYLHQRHVGEFRVGAAVKFQAYLHQGKLQGRGLQDANGQVNSQQSEIKPVLESAAGEQQLGVFVGTIKSYNVEKGFGFVESAGLKAQGYGMDAFLHKSFLGEFNVGDIVSFSAYLKDSKLRARNLQPTGGGMGGMVSMSPLVSGGVWGGLAGMSRLAGIGGCGMNMGGKGMNGKSMDFADMLRREVNDNAKRMRIT